MNNKIKEYRDFNEILRAKLKNPQFAIGYLNEALASKDKGVFLLALQHVLEAHGNMNDSNEDSKLNSLADLFVNMGIQVEFKLA
jgi:DNA-binding phage protein